MTSLIFRVSLCLRSRTYPDPLSFQADSGLSNSNSLARLPVIMNVFFFSFGLPGGKGERSSTCNVLALVISEAAMNDSEEHTV